MEQRHPDSGVLAEFKKRKTRQLIAAIPAVLMILLLVGAQETGWIGLAGIPATVLQPVAVAIILAVVAFSLLNWRCPSCKAYLGKRINPRFCAKCSEQLQH